MIAAARGLAVGILLVALAPMVGEAQAVGEIDADSDAQVAFQNGQAAFQRGHYASAMESFREAYELEPRPELLYDIGESANRADEPREALEAFEAYLAEISDVHPRRSAIERRVVDLQELVAREDAEDREDAGPAPWIIAGVGGASAITGGVLIGVGLDTRTSASDPALAPADVEAAESRARAMLGAGIVLATLGVLALAGGLYWGVSSRSGAVIEAGLGPMSLRLRGRF